MDAVIMAGGLAQRLGMGEKSCIKINGKYLIAYVIEALENTKGIEDIYISVTDATPLTKELLETEFKDRVKVIVAKEGNYVQDMIYTIKKTGTKGPVMVAMCDLPLIEPDLLEDIMLAYDCCIEPALSTYVPIKICKEIGIRPDTVFHKNGKLIIPIGINILDSNDMENEQPDFNYIIEDHRAAMNINTPKDLNNCEIVISRGKDKSGKYNFEGLE